MRRYHRDAGDGGGVGLLAVETGVGGYRENVLEM